MRFTHLLTDDALLGELGAGLERARLERNLTQAQVAEKAGVSKSTLERLEGGASSQLTTLIRVLRALDLLEGLNQLLPETPFSPIEQLKLRGKTRQRASAPKVVHADKTGPWRWGDQS
ncbi:helix-turn-helix domain-containing protein [Phenylobacterium sp.]|jgi:transcriptional regulator with XRE-family HTH domain|uniref:helix-turn-helix domain-containing protein n=1 Tax=Phenylobacterium sp. TaxID=1871053 RepID=UPI0037CB7757